MIEKACPRRPRPSRQERGATGTEGSRTSGHGGTYVEKKEIQSETLPKNSLCKRLDRLPDGLGVGLVSDRHRIENRQLNAGFAEGGELFPAACRRSDN